MPSYGDIIYNITAMYVAALGADNSYGTPALVEYGQDFTYEYTADQDEIKSYGLIVEALAIIIKATGTLKEASLNIASKEIMTGSSESESGSTPNRVSILDIQVGGAGLPYFGLIVAGASVVGNVLVGFPKAKLETWPSFTIEQNKFRMGEAKVNMFAPSTVIRKLVRTKKYETVTNPPTDAEGFDTFFSTPTAMFDA